MSTDLTLHQRRRKPTADELQGIPWLRLLRPDERAHAVAELLVGDAAPGRYVCGVGKPVTYWVGVVEGLLELSSDDAEGQTMTFADGPPRGWFGAATAREGEPYRHNIQAA